jgi:ATP-dependent protease ClpP protease subunit
MNKKFKLDCEIASETGYHWFGRTVGPDALNLFLDNLKVGDKATIVINSPGGDVIAGLAMANAIKNCKAEITAHIVGVAASMASVIACACDKIVMEEASFMMVHNPWTIAAGDAETLRHEAETLDNMRSAIMAFYRGKFKSLTEDEIKAMCDEETWLIASDALAKGLDCEVVSCEMRAAACISQIGFAKIPEGAKAFLTLAVKGESQEETAAAGEAPAAEETSAAAETSAAEAPSEDEEVSSEVEETSTTEETSAVEETSAAEEVSAPSAEGSWEARYKGASKKINLLQKAHAAQIAEMEKNFNARITQLENDLNTARDMMSSVEKERDDAVKALGEMREQAEKANKAHARLAGGVLVPSSKAPRSAAEINKDNSLTPAERSKLLASGDYV